MENVELDSSTSSPRHEQWEIVIAEQELQPVVDERAIHPSEDGDPEIENLLSDMEFESVQCLASTSPRQEGPDLPVSSNLAGVDFHISDGCMSDFSSGTSDFENLKDSSLIQDPSCDLMGAADHLEKNGSGSHIPEDVDELKDACQKEDLAEKFVEEESQGIVKKDAEVLEFTAAESNDSKAGGETATLKDVPLTSLPWHTRLHHKCMNMWARLSFDCGKSSILGQLKALTGGKEWKLFFWNLGMVAASALIVGLYARNRSLSRSLKRKHEEIARLMVTLMNFQDLLGANRSNVPLIRHASIGVHHSY